MMDIKIFLIKELRARKGHVPELCKKAGVRPSTVQSWINADIMPSLEKAEKILNAMGYRIVLKRCEKENKDA